MPAFKVTIRSAWQWADTNAEGERHKALLKERDNNVAAAADAITAELQSRCKDMQPAVRVVAAQVEVSFIVNAALDADAEVKARYWWRRCTHVRAKGRNLGKLVLVKWEPPIGKVTVSAQ